MRAVGWLLLLGWLAAGRALAEGYPIPRAEHPVSWKAQLTVGDWRVEGDELSLAKARVNRNFFFQEGAAPVTLLRARVRDAAHADLAFLFRARVRATEPQLALTGYGLSLEGRRETVGFLRFDGARVDDSGAKAKVRGLARASEVELVLLVAGPVFAAHVYDARTKEELASVVWSDAAFPEGTLGVYAQRNQAPDVTVTLSVPDAPPQEAEARDSLPAEWLVRVDRDTVLPPEVRRRFRRVAREEAADVYVGSELGVYLLREHAIPLRELQPGAPYEFMEPSLAERLARARKAPVSEGFVDGLKDPELVERALRALAARHPRLTRLLEVGRTHEDRPILGLAIGEALDDPSRPAVLLCGATHGNELSTTEPPLDAARWLLDNPQKDPRATRWLHTFHVVIVPLINVDGSYHFWHVSSLRGRTNRFKDPQAQRLQLFEYGVDLNRNYPFQWKSVADRYNSDEARSPFWRGPEPGSEPEVRAMMKLGEAWRFVAMITYHGAAGKLLVPYTVDGARDTTPSAAWAVAPGMVSASGTFPGNRRYEAVRHLYPVSGTDQDWFYWSFGTLAYLVELPYSVPGPRRPLEAMIEASRPLWQVLMGQFLEGPAVTIQVPEAFRTEGPVGVVIEPIVWKNGEHFTAPPDSGVFHAYLPAAGRYTVRATSASGRTVSRTVNVGTSHQFVSLDETPAPAN